MSDHQPAARVQFGQYPAPRLAIAHISDVHLLAGGRRQYGAIDTERGLSAALDRVARLDPPPRALVFTGDLADRAEPDAYARLSDLVGPVAARLGAQVVWVIGNHDEREPFARELRGLSDDGPQDQVVEVDGVRIIALDTTVPGYHHGEISPGQLAWLGETLSTPAEHGTILAMHHPPIPVPTVEPAAIIELLDQDRLAEVIAGTDVRQILGGHFHYSSHSTFAGIPVSVASATCYATDPAPLDRLISGVDGHRAFNAVHLYDDRIVHTVVPVDAAPEVTGESAELRSALEALSAEELRDMISRKDSPLNQES